MRRIVTIILAILLALGAVEGIAWWWMHPAPAGLGEPVLAYRREIRGQESGVRGQESGVRSQGSGIRGQEEDQAQSSSPIQQLSINNPQLVPAKRSGDGSSISSSSSSISASQHLSVSASTHTPLPEIYRQAAPMLRCTSGQVFHVQISDTASLHGAFFEWDGTDTGSVLEAFRHMPEACMGSIGMQLVSKEKPIHYVVRGQESGIRGQESEVRSQESGVRGQETEGRGQESGVRGQETEGRDQETEGRGQESGVRSQEEAPAQSSSSNQQSSILNPQLVPAKRSGDGSSISSSSSPPNIQSQISNISLTFDHTVFRDPGQGGNPLVPGPHVHAFRAVWVSGTPEADARSGLDGRGFDQLRSIRLNSALTRYRPRHARVIQGAVRGMHTPEAAWAAFEEHMLKDLKFE